MKKYDLHKIMKAAHRYTESISSYTSLLTVYRLSVIA